MDYWGKFEAFLKKRSIDPDIDENWHKDVTKEFFKSKEIYKEERVSDGISARIAQNSSSYAFKIFDEIEFRSTAYPHEFEIGVKRKRYDYVDMLNAREREYFLKRKIEREESTWFREKNIKELEIIKKAELEAEVEIKEAEQLNNELEKMRESQMECIIENIKGQESFNNIYEKCKNILYAINKTDLSYEYQNFERYLLHIKNEFETYMIHQANDAGGLTNLKIIEMLNKSLTILYNNLKQVFQDIYYTDIDSNDQQLQEQIIYNKNQQNNDNFTSAIDFNASIFQNITTNENNDFDNQELFFKNATTDINKYTLTEQSLINTITIESVTPTSIGAKNPTEGIAINNRESLYGTKSPKEELQFSINTGESSFGTTDTLTASATPNLICSKNPTADVNIASNNGESLFNTTYTSTASAKPNSIFFMNSTENVKKNVYEAQSSCNTTTSIESVTSNPLFFKNPIKNAYSGECFIHEEHSFSNTTNTTDVPNNIHEGQSLFTTAVLTAPVTPTSIFFNNPIDVVHKYINEGQSLFSSNLSSEPAKPIPFLFGNRTEDAYENIYKGPSLFNTKSTESDFSTSIFVESHTKDEQKTVYKGPSLFNTKSTESEFSTSIFVESHTENEQKIVYKEPSLFCTTSTPSEISTSFCFKTSADNVHKENVGKDIYKGSSLFSTTSTEPEILTSSFFNNGVEDANKDTYEEQPLFSTTSESATPNSILFKNSKSDVYKDTHEGQCDVNKDIYEMQSPFSTSTSNESVKTTLSLSSGYKVLETHYTSAFAETTSEGSTNGFIALFSSDHFELYNKINGFYQTKLKSVKSFENNTNLKAYRSECQKIITTTINAIGAQSPDFLKHKFDRIYNFINGHPIKIQRRAVTVNDHPFGRDYCLLLIAKQFANQAKSQLSKNLATVFAMASVAVSLWKLIPDFGVILLACLYTESPICVPRYTLPQSCIDLKDYVEFLNDKNGNQQDYLDQQIGYAQLFAAIMTTNGRKIDGPSHPFSVDQCWIWLTNIIKLDPLPQISATVIREVLNIVCADLYSCYGSQFLKLLNYIKSIYLPKIKEIDMGGAVSRLEMWLEDFLLKKIVPIPPGLLTKQYW